MTAISGMRTARLAGFAVGAALAVALLLASRPASGGAAAGADVSVYANQTGELAVSPPGPATFLDAPRLHPGQSANGSFRLTNQTGVDEAIALSAVPSSHRLDETLSLRLRSRGRTLANGTLSSLESIGGRLLVLRPGETAKVSGDVYLARDAGPDAAAALVQVAIHFELGAAGR
jgi:hypothetical protein